MLTEPGRYFAIPALDFERAYAFYALLTPGLLIRAPQTPFPLAYFQYPGQPPRGHLFQAPTFQPSLDGPLLYFGVSTNIPTALARIEAAGGRTLLGATSLGPGRGAWALFADTEGNRLALHAS
jgi:hypothetical protein